MSTDDAPHDTTEGRPMDAPVTDRPHTTDPTPPPRSRRWWVVAFVALAVVAGTAAWMVPGSDEPDDEAFCRTVASLPALSSSAATTGTPAAGYTEFAEQLDELARTAERDGAANGAELAAAARTLAEHQRTMAAALDGSVSADDVVDRVSNIEGAPVEAARTTLADAIEERCN